MLESGPAVHGRNSARGLIWPSEIDLAADQSTSIQSANTRTLRLTVGIRRQVVGPVHEPGREALELDAVHLRDALVQAEAGDRADVLVPVVGFGSPPRSAATMFSPSTWPGGPRAGRSAGTARRVLAVRDRSGTAALSPAVQASSRPRPPAASASQRTRPRSSSGRSESGEHRVGLDAGGPHDGVAVELGAVREHDVPVLERLDRGATARPRCRACSSCSTVYSPRSRRPRAGSARPPRPAPSACRRARCCRSSAVA